MRVLLIAYHYPPDPAVGSIRAGRVAASLVAAGHQVQVLSISHEEFPAEVDDGGIRVRRLTKAFDARSTLVGLKHLFRRASRRNGIGPNGQSDRAAAEAAWRPPEVVPAWSRYLSSVLWLPDSQQGWIPPVVAAGLRAISRGVDVIYTTAPPFSAHIAGLLLKRMTGVRWVAEMRDPWIGNPWKPWYVRSRATDTMDSWLERRCMRNANRVVAVTASAAKDLASRAGVGDSVVLVRNGIPAMPDATVAEPKRRTEELRIVYVGSLYHGRDPRPFLEGLATLKAAGRLPLLRVEFIGNCSHFRGVDLTTLCAQLGLSDVVRFVPPVPHAECQERIRDADLLLLLAQEQPSQVPQKLYEYMATGRPVIAFADAEGETAEMVREVGGHYLITGSEPDHVAVVLEAALRSKGERRGLDPDVLREWSAERQMERLVGMVEEVGS